MTPESKFTTPPARHRRTPDSLVHPMRDSSRPTKIPTPTTTRRKPGSLSLRQRFTSRKRLDFSTPPVAAEPPVFTEGPLSWSLEETCALLEFLCIHAPDTWPTGTKKPFWSSVSEFVQQRSNSTRTRGGKQLCAHCYYSNTTLIRVFIHSICVQS